MSMLAELCGVWSLIPERCVYNEALPAPRSGVHTLLLDPEDATHLFAHVRWRGGRPGRIQPREKTHLLATIRSYKMVYSEVDTWYFGCCWLE